MAKRYGSRSRGGVRRARSSRGYSRGRVSRGRTGGRSNTRSRTRAAGARQQTVRIVLESPRENPMLTAPVGKMIENAIPRKRAF